jgi:hypothetical protein
MWGNWGLAGDIKVGAVGLLSNDGGFRQVGALAGVTSDSEKRSESWQLSTTHVKRSQASVTLDANGNGIPVGATGATVGGTLGTTITWTFSASNELSSEFKVSRREQIKDEVAVVAANKELLNTLAKSVGMAAAGAIDQGFGFIRAIVWAESGANVAAFTSGSTFSLTGKANAVASLVGNTSGSGSVQASYSTSSQEGNLDTHLWPAAPSTPPEGEVPLAYLFTSFEGEVLLPDWIGFVQNVVMEFHNHGSYIATVNIRYEDSKGTTTETYGGISGGLSRQILLPLDARDVQLTVTYAASSMKHTVTIHAPFAQSVSGRFNYDIGGFWPSGPTLTPR